MALDTASGRRSLSPASSGRSTPVPRNSRRLVEDGVYKADKSLRRYGAIVERAVSSWEISPQEWADYIAFLGRLLKAVQSHPKDAPFLPHSAAVASRLAQCLNPALPSGVHQKALEVYTYIFATFGQEYICGHLNEFWPGLSAVLSFASLSVRPALYEILEHHIVRLPASDIRPVLRSLILSLLPALEEETSEDFERAFRILEALENTFTHPHGSEAFGLESAGYFWQCLFLAVITSPTRRQGALNFLTQRLPKFSRSSVKAPDVDHKAANGVPKMLSQAAEAIISPEPGLLIRCIACGLSDAQTLIQRGFLDLLVTHLPLDSRLLQHRVRKEDLELLVSAAVQVLTRREMSLNRRLWSWFLGPEATVNASDKEAPSPDVEKGTLTRDQESKQVKYFLTYGKATLTRSVLAMFKRPTLTAVEKARPFRICLSLMDRWEIGGSIVPPIFLPAIESVYQYSRHASSNETAEVLRSSSLFFDGVEARLIWANLLDLLKDSFANNVNQDKLDLFGWVVRHFNFKDEEMLLEHIPNATAYILSLLSFAREVPAEKANAALDTATMLLEMIPERVLQHSTSSPTHGISNSLSPSEIQRALDAFYKNSQGSRRNDHTSAIPAVADEISSRLRSLMMEAITQGPDRTVVQAVPMLLMLDAKAPNTHLRGVDRFPETVLRAIDTALSSKRNLGFPAMSSIVTLVVSLGTVKDHGEAISETAVRALIPLLATQVWDCLSPASPKYHVEAVKSVWQLEDLAHPQDTLQASLSALVRQSLQATLISKRDCEETARRFAVLWDHSIPASPRSIKHAARGQGRRVSSVASVSDAQQIRHRVRVLTEPLLLLLDTLNKPNRGGLDVVKSWLDGLPSLDQVFALLFEAIGNLAGSQMDQEGTNSQRSDRLRLERDRQLEYSVVHFTHILQHSTDWTWQCLDDVSHAGKDDEGATNGIIALAECCTSFLCSDEYTSASLEQVSLAMLGMLLSGPSAVALKPLDLDSRLIEALMKQLGASKCDLQGQMLKEITQALKVRLMSEASEPSANERPRGSISLKRPPPAGSRQFPDGSTTVLAPVPPSQLLACLRMGFSTSTAHSHLDQWLVFLSNILPIFADAIFSSLIPMIECFCAELDKAYRDLVSVAGTESDGSVVAPEARTMVLLEATNMVLSRAHECLLAEQGSDPVPKTNVQPRSLLGNVTSGVFKAEGPPSRTAQSNSRLTVILTFHDAIRAATRLWTWASHPADIVGFDKGSALTTSYNAVKVRNRTRHLLEQIFAAEPLESLEVIVYNWCHLAGPGEAAGSLDLLHAMQGSRPKSTIPAILDALCSRTNPMALPLARQSSKTVDLSPLDVALFLSAYLHSIEDDAMDEVWSDCMAFVRDVTTNPLPYRQVLPALLSVISLLARKVDNTNFGEQRKMRRELGDSFLRLLAATFTTMPSGRNDGPLVTEPEPMNDDLSNSAVGMKETGLFVVLRHALLHIDVVLETSDRTTSAINNICGSLIAPVLRARSFPSNVHSDCLALLLQMAKTSPTNKSWKREVWEAFNDARLLASTAKLMEEGWFPILQQLCLYDKERMAELLSRLAPPSSAGIMFGVGANAARLEADRKTQLNLRRICILLLSSPEDTFVAHLRTMEEKLVELLEASLSSSPSSAIKAELYMLCRALVLSTSAVQFSPLWPIVNDSLHSALTSLLPNATEGGAFGNIALLQACKLLDLLVALSPDEFQLHEWLYVCDTIDAVYRPASWNPSSLSDQIADAYAAEGAEESTLLVSPIPPTNGPSGRRRPLIDRVTKSDEEDIKASPKDDFVRNTLRPFLSQLSIHAYEGVYSMDAPDAVVCRHMLLEDLVDLTTIVE